MIGPYKTGEAEEPCCLDFASGRQLLGSGRERPHGAL